MPVPFTAWHALARIFEMLPKPAITSNQIELMQIDTVASPAKPGLAELGVSPHAVEEILQQITHQLGWPNAGCASDVVIKQEFVWMRAQTNLVELARAFVAYMGFHHVLGEHVTLEQERVIALERVKGFFERSWC
jgi:hypothetical protein